MTTQQILSKYTLKNHIILTKRGNESIKLTLAWAKEKGYTRLCIPQFGGWMTYSQFGEKYKYEVCYIPTHNEIISQKNLQNMNLNEKTVVLVHSLAGYHTKLDTKMIRKTCDNHKSLFIEDTVGTLGKYSTFGHIVIASFGKAKPIDLGVGGFVATNNTDLAQYVSEFTKSDVDTVALEEKLQNLTRRYEFLYRRREELKTKLQKPTIGDENALVIIVPFSTDVEKQELIAFCEQENVEWTECPRYIRHDKPAISIEIKRLVSQ